MSRLKEMGKEIQAGRPVSGIMDELAAIVGRVMPEMPRNEIDRNEIDPTNDPNHQLKQQDQKQLEKPKRSIKPSYESEEIMRTAYISCDISIRLLTKG